MLIAQSLLDQDVAIVIAGMETRKLCCFASDVTKIPLIRMHDKMNHGCMATSLKFCQHSFALNAGYQDYSRAVVSLLDRFAWSKITIIYEPCRFHEVAHFKSLTFGKNYDLLFVNARQTSEPNQTTDQNIQRILKQVQLSSSQVQLLFVDIKTTKLILQKVFPCPTNQADKIWIINGRVSMKIAALDSNIVIGFRQYLHKEATRIIFTNITDDLTKGEALEDLDESVFLAFDAMRVAMEACKHIVERYWSQENSSKVVKIDRETLYEYISQIKTRGLTGLIAFDEKGRRKDIQFEVLNLRDNSFVKVGSYDGAQHVSKRLNLKENLKPNIVKSKTSGFRLEGSNLKVVTVLETPYVIKTQLSDGSVVYEGYSIDLLKEIAKQLKFTYQIYESPDNYYGTNNSGKWNGAIKELLDENADIIVAALTITEAREEVVDFTAVYEFYTEDLLMKKEKSMEDFYDSMHFLSPYTFEIWVGLLFCIFLVTTALFAINYCSPYGIKNERGLGTGQEFSLSNCLWFSLACMLLQGADHPPASSSARILASGFWLYVLVWIATYTANFAASFTIERHTHSVNSLEDALISGRRFVALNASNVHSLFRDSDFPRYKKVWDRMIASSSNSDAVKKVREENLIFISGGPPLKYIARKKPCDLITIPGLSSPEGMGFALRLGDPRRNNLTLSILSLRDNGHMRKLRLKWWLYQEECFTETIFKGKQITLDKMRGVFGLLGIGAFVSFLVLGIEILWYKKREKTTYAVRPIACQRVNEKELDSVQ